MMKIVLFIFLSFLSYSLIAQPQPIRNTRNFIDQSFESSDFWNSFQTADTCCEWSMKRTDSVSYTGSWALRAEWRKGDNSGGFRSEIVGWTETSMFNERYYEFKMLIPAGGYTISPIYKIVFQLHETPDFILGEDYRSPPFALSITDNQWDVTVRWDADPVNTNANIDGSQVYVIAPLQTNTWVKWKIRYKPAYDTTGILQVWKDDQLVVNRINQPNYYNDFRGPYPKWGIYNPAANDISDVANKLIVIIDDILIASNSGQKIGTFKTN